MRIGPGGESERVGSGKLEKPCARMHLANPSAARNWLSVACTPGAPPGASFAHARRADLNDGDCGLIPAPARLIPPAPAFGSGKLGTPWARMQFANATGCEWAPERVVLLRWCEDPQAASATAQLTAARLPHTLRRPRSRISWQVVRLAA